MADFCKKCSLDVWGEDTKDLAGLLTIDEAASGEYATPVLCEGCGSIYVNQDGHRVVPSDDGLSWLEA